MSSCGLSIMAWIYVTVALTITIMFMIDSGNADETTVAVRTVETVSSTALTYMGFFMATFTLIIGPLFAISLVTRTHHALTFLMVIIQHLWLCLTIAYTMLIAANLIPVRVTVPPLPATALFALFLILIALQLWSIKLTISQTHPAEPVEDTESANGISHGSLPSYLEASADLFQPSRNIRTEQYQIGIGLYDNHGDPHPTPPPSYEQAIKKMKYSRM